jgi:hypothetical protein
MDLDHGRVHSGRAWDSDGTAQSGPSQIPDVVGKTGILAVSGWRLEAFLVHRWKCEAKTGNRAKSRSGLEGAKDPSQRKAARCGCVLLKPLDHAGG